MKNTSFALGDLAKAIAGGNVRQMAKLLNDIAGSLGVEAKELLDENTPDPAQLVSREAVILLAAERIGDRGSDIVSRRARRFLDAHPWQEPANGG